MFKCPFCNHVSLVYPDIISHAYHKHPNRELTAVPSITEEQYKALLKAKKPKRKKPKTGKKNKPTPVSELESLKQEYRRLKKLLTIIEDIEPEIMQTAIDHLDPVPSSLQQYIAQAKEITVEPT